jgi:hypothetical protein
MKKAQGLPLNVIIIAIIALIVLAVIIAIFAGKIQLFGKGVSDCKAKGGECRDFGECKPDEAPVSGLCGEDKICCIPI